LAAPHATLPVSIQNSARKLLTELCAISSTSDDADGLRRMADRLARELSARGLDTAIEMQPGEGGAELPVVLARGPEAGERCLLLVGHMDTVLPAVPPRIEGDRLLATGGLDMKGGLVTLIAALDLMAARGDAVPGDITLVVVPDEEASGVISTRTMEQWGKRARALLVIEPGEARNGGETIVTGRRGLVEWRLEVTGRAAHSGLAFWHGRSALVAAAAWATRAHALSVPGPGVTVNVARLVAGDRDFVDDLAHHHELLGSARRRNVVSERALADGEIRFLSLAERDRALARLAELALEIAQEYDVTVSFTPGQAVSPVDPHGPGTPLAERAVELARAQGWQLEVEHDRGGVSFPNFVPNPERIAILDCLAPVGDGMHTREEFLDLTSLDRRIVLLADLLASL
jgi:glutamate carboxypeptidase